MIIVSVPTQFRVKPLTSPLCDVCGVEPSVVMCHITDPLISTIATRLCADCEPLHARAVVTLLARERHLVVSWAGAI